jgi:predicted nucleic acid-binding protein
MENFYYFNNEETNYTKYLIKEVLKKRYILDASVVSKWYYQKDEEDFKNALIIYNKLQSENYTFFAPDLLIYELLNIYRNKSELDSPRINKIISELYDLIVIVGINKNTFSKSFQISRKFDISLYDSVYIAITEDLGANLITADKRLYDSIKLSNSKITLLSDFL